MDHHKATPGCMVVAIGLFFLKVARQQGMTYAEAAGFLSRNEAEVRKKAKQMKIPYGRLRLTLITAYDEERECLASKVSELSRCYTCTPGLFAATCARSL
jgi:hypothetical protein